MISRNLLIVIAILLLLFVFGCENSNPQQDTVDQITLKVLYPNKNNFHSRWGAKLQEILPHTKIEVVETEDLLSTAENPKEALIELIKKEAPDLLYMTDLNEYEGFVDTQLLAPIEDLMLANEYDLDEIYPPALELLRYKYGLLYGLPLYFDTKVLFFNKEIFDNQQVPYPTDNMSWDEVLDLAKKMSNTDEHGNRYYGIEDYDWDESPYNPFLLTEAIAATNQLYYVNDQGRITINNQEWRALFGTIADAYREGIIYLPEQRDLLYEFNGVTGAKVVNKYVIDKKFLAGRTAMSYSRSTLLGYLYGGFQEVEKFEWDMVQAPADPAYQMQSANLELWDIFGIYSGSPHFNESLELLKYLTGEAIASSTSDLSLFSKHNGERFPVRAKYIIRDGEQVTGITQRKLDTKSLYIYYSVDKDFFKQFRELASQAMWDIIEDPLIIDDALNQLQSSGQSLLNRY